MYFSLCLVLGPLAVAMLIIPSLGGGPETLFAAPLPRSLAYSTTCSL